MNRVYILYIVVYLAAVSFSSTIAAPAQQWFEKANSFYEKQHYDSAAQCYEKAVETGMQNSQLFYNLGNAYFRLHKLGLAILYYEKALKLSPKDKDIQANIRFAQRTVVDRVPETPRTFFENVLWYMHTLFSLHVQLWALLFFLLIISICFVAGLYASHNVRLWLVYAASLCVVIAMLFGISIGVKIYQTENYEYAIVLKKSVDAKNQPNGDKVLFTAHEGVKFQIRKTMDDWALVNLPNGVSGWVERNALGKI